MTTPSFQPLTVSRLTQLLKDLVEENFMEVLVEGEISNLASPASGHLYLTLKDSQAQLRAVMFRPQVRLLRFTPENGMRVLVAGRLSLYQQRGEVQFIIETLQPQGIGALQIAFEQTKARLAEEGLFAADRKRPLPSYPRVVGVVTSATGAAIHDILNVLQRRAFGLQVLLRPVRVQGDEAAEEIAAAIADLNREGTCNVIIVGRGGGSLEDLWAFNEEIVARAIFESEIPIISAVGHEIDFTIADFVADLRAPTPSAAAELVAKSRLELEAHVDQLLLRLTSTMTGKLRLLEEKIIGLQQRLRSPQQRIEQWQRQLADMEKRLINGMKQHQRAWQAQFGELAGRLETLSPLRTLARGYAIVVKDGESAPICSSESLHRDDPITIRFHRGSARARIEDTKP